MEHIELKYCVEIDLDTDLILSGAESILKEHDNTVLQLSSRSYHYDTLSPHVFIQLALSKKQHRQENYMNDLINKLKLHLMKVLPQDIPFSIEIRFLSPYYASGKSTDS
ncbi:MAG: hypothetical protein CMF46_00090 [Legionellales bacterium]|nr:hypothetical protein [Legionellales bacterium]|tara:strand:+ start:352 stop:678 length:327 start_codon:yes stop_codon:yes gene_type:complete